MSPRIKAHIILIWMLLSLWTLCAVFCLFEGILQFRTLVDGELNIYTELSINMDTTWRKCWAFIVPICLLFFTSQLISNWWQSLKDNPRQRRKVTRSDILDDDFKLD